MSAQKPKKMAAFAAEVMVALLAIYIAAVLYRAFMLFTEGGVVGGLMALALLVLSLVAIWALYREVRFGAQATKLTKILASANQLKIEGITADISGRPNREEALLVLANYAEKAAAEPVSWQALIRLAIVQRAAGQAQQARKSTNRAIALAQKQGVL